MERYTMFIGLEDSVLLRCDLATNCCKSNSIPAKFSKFFIRNRQANSKIYLEIQRTQSDWNSFEKRLVLCSSYYYFINTYLKLQKSRRYRIGLMIDLYNSGRQWRVGRPTQTWPSECSGVIFECCASKKIFIWTKVNFIFTLHHTEN